MLLEHTRALVPPPAFALPDGAHEAGRKHELVLDVNAPVRRLCIACIACPSPVRPQRRTAGPASGRRVSRDTNTHQDGRVAERAAAAETPGHARGGSLVSSASSLFLAAPGIFFFTAVTSLLHLPMLWLRLNACVQTLITRLVLVGRANVKVRSPVSRRDLSIGVTSRAHRRRAELRGKVKTPPKCPI